PVTAVIKATNSGTSHNSGTIVSNTRTVTRNPVGAPQITITSPANNHQFTTQSLTVSGTAVGVTTVHLWVQTDQWYYQDSASVNSSRNRSTTLSPYTTLFRSPVTAVIKATNSGATHNSGTVVSNTRTVTRNPAPPSAPSL